MQDITPPPPPLAQADSHLRPPFTYPKPPFAAAKRWRPPHPSLVLFAMMFVSACGGGGSSPAPAFPAPAVVSLELEITPTDGAKIKLDGATILPEEQNGSESEGGKPVSLGILTDNKNGNGEAVYKNGDRRRCRR